MADIAKKEKGRTANEPPIGHSNVQDGATAGEGSTSSIKKRPRHRASAGPSDSTTTPAFVIENEDEDAPVHPLLSKEKVQVKSHIDLVNRPRPGGRFEKAEIESSGSFVVGSSAGPSIVPSSTALGSSSTKLHSVDGSGREIDLDQFLALTTGYLTSNGFSSFTTPIINALNNRIYNRLRSLLSPNLPSLQPPSSTRTRSNSTSVSNQSKRHTPPHILPAPASGAAYSPQDSLDSNIPANRARSEYIQQIVGVARRTSQVWKNSVEWWLDLFPPSSKHSSGTIPLDGGRGLESVLSNTLIRELVDAPSGSGPGSSLSGKSSKASYETASTLLAVALTTYLDTESGFGGSALDDRSREWASLGEVLASLNDFGPSVGDIGGDGIDTVRSQVCAFDVKLRKVD